MKTKLVILLSLLTSLSFASADVKRVKVSKKVKIEIIQALENYETLFSSYFEYNNEEIVANSKKLSASLEKISDKKIVESLKKESVFTFLKAIKINKNRSVNDSLMDNISKRLNELILTKYDIGSDYNFYNCPMVKKDWIQNSKKMDKVHNPYAPYMKHCGSKTSKY